MKGNRRMAICRIITIGTFNRIRLHSGISSCFHQKQVSEILQKIQEERWELAQEVDVDNNCVLLWFNSYRRIRYSHSLFGSNVINVNIGHST